jgi:hypothetical protein
LFPGSEVAETDADERWFLGNIVSDYARDQVSHSTMCCNDVHPCNGRYERGSSLVRNMHAWGQDRASNNAMSRFFEILVFVLFIAILAREMPHFYQ